MCRLKGVDSRFSRDVTAAVLMYRTMAKQVFWEFDSIHMQNLGDILPLFSTPTRVKTKIKMALSCHRLVEGTLSVYDLDH